MDHPRPLNQVKVGIMEGGSGGGILATHPATQERIDALKKL